MSLRIIKQPADVCFAADGVEYAIMETSMPGTHQATSVKFRLWIIDDTHRPDYITKDIELLSIPSIGDQNEDLYAIDITDIIQAYTEGYDIINNAVPTGYVKVKLLSVGNTQMTDTEHICLPGASGGLKLSGELPANTHPFLLARGNEEGALHLYRSELYEMEYLYAYVSNTYDSYYIETDNADQDSEDIYDKIIGISGCYNLFAIWLTDNAGSKYGIWRDSNALYLYYCYNNELRINTIAIKDDPDTDDTCMLKWTNSMGAPEVLLLTGEMRDISEIESPDLYITRQTPKETRMSYLRRAVTTKYNMQTGYLTPARICALKDLLTSDSVYMKQDDQWIQVLVSSDAAHAVHQREPESFELTIEVMTQTRYHKPNRTVNPLPDSRESLLQDNEGNIILDNNSNTIQENG